MGGRLTAMKLEFTEQEAEAVLECVDTALGVHKLKALNAANMIVAKISAARKQEQNEKVAALPHPAPADAASGAT